MIIERASIEHDWVTVRPNGRKSTTRAEPCDRPCRGFALVRAYVSGMAGAGIGETNANPPHMRFVEPMSPSPLASLVVIAAITFVFLLVPSTDLYFCESAGH